MEPNWFGWIMILIFVGALLAGLGLWAFGMFLALRHFVFLREASSDWHQFFRRFRVGNERDVRTFLSPAGVRNLDLALKVNRINWPVFIAGGGAFALGMLWGGWSGHG